MTAADIDLLTKSIKEAEEVRGSHCVKPRRGR
jgi:hypothetical protein